MAKSIQELIAERFGVRTFPETNPVTATVGTTAVVVARANSGRVALNIINLSANNVFVGPFADVATGKGFALSPNGGFVTVNVEDDYVLPGREWSAIASGAGSAIMVLETNIGPDAS